MKKVLISFRIDERLLSRINDIAQKAGYRTTSSVINTVIESALYNDDVPENIPFDELERRFDILVPMAHKRQIELHELWKPSMEQMDALFNAFNIAKNSGNESANDLRTLYEQLSKF